MAKDAEKPAEKVNANGVPLFKSDLTALDVKLDKEIVYEFGGPVGVCAMMLGFPALMYYFWVTLEYHQGKMIVPDSFTLDGIKEFVLNELWAKIKEGAYPSLTAVKIYMGYVLFSFILAYIMPGPVVEGLAIPSMKGKKASIQSCPRKTGVEFTCRAKS